MNLSEYILLSREERTRHIDLSSPCVFGDWRGSRCFDFFELNDDVEVWKGKIGRNHVCPNDTQCGGPICVNPLHWYYGTNSENMGDVKDKERFKVGGRTNKGRKHPPRTEQQRQNYRDGVKKRHPVSEETRQKMRDSWKTRKPFSEESKRKMSLSRLGKKRGPYKKRNEKTTSD